MQPDSGLPVFSPSEFVALVNQALELSYPLVEVEGEVLQFRTSKNRWVYFDIADESARIRCFGTVYQMPAPVDDGMRVRILAVPRLHPLYGFSLNVQGLQFSGEGSIKRAAEALRQKLEQEGLFAEDRKRALPYPPASIGLITSDESAAFKDFMKVLGARWGGVRIMLVNVQVQGEAAPGQIVRAIEWFNAHAEVPDVLVLTRGGGSADDLQAFSSEQVTRAVAASRVPTLVAIGHEVDISLAELAADMRASTPSNAAELLVPDRKQQLQLLGRQHQQLAELLNGRLRAGRRELLAAQGTMHDLMSSKLRQAAERLERTKLTLDAYSPQATLRRGYAIVRKNNKAVRRTQELKAADRITITFADGTAEAAVQ